MKRVKLTFLNAFGQVDGEMKWSVVPGYEDLAPDILLAGLMEHVGLPNHRQVIQLSDTNAHANLYSILLEVVDE